MSEIPNFGEADHELKAKATEEYQALIRVRFASINLYASLERQEILDEFSGLVNDETIDGADAVAIFDKHDTRINEEVEIRKAEAAKMTYDSVRKRYQIDFDPGDYPEEVDENDPRYDA